MITFSRFGNYGRLGNQLFQYAAMIGMARKYSQELFLPYWHYEKYFFGEFPATMPPGIHTWTVDESAYHYTPQQYDDLAWGNENYDFKGYFQSEKYWEHCTTEVRQALEFSADFSDHVYEKHFQQLKRGGKTIAISVRRGDYIDNPNYELLPVTYYFLALQKHFPEWEDMDLLIFSDDPEWCKIHFGCLENAHIIPNNFDYSNKRKYFDHNEQAMIQLCLMSMCDHFIIANSTFSWWGAYLGNKPFSKTIRPAHYFRGPMKESHDLSDHYPKEWICFDHLDEHGNLKKIDLDDVAFMIPVSYDHKDRKQNLNLNVCLLQRYFDTNIIIGENINTGNGAHFKYFEQWCQYVQYDFSDFHRTRMLNEMAKISDTGIIANWDADVFISPIQVWKAVDAIRRGANMVFPYDGRFARVGRAEWFRKIEKSLDVGSFGKTVFKGMRPIDKPSVGGAIFFDIASFFHGGGENERFVAYGPEDVERDVRFRKLGYDVRRITGTLYHMDHYVGPNSKCHGNPYNKQNHDELEKTYALSPKQLREYVNTWISF